MASTPLKHGCSLHPRKLRKKTRDWRGNENQAYFHESKGEERLSYTGWAKKTGLFLLLARYVPNVAKRSI